MKSRGYGLPGRTAFSIYRFDKRDRAILLWLLVLGGYILVGWLTGNMAWQYVLVIQGAVGAFPVTFQLAYLALCLTPIILNRKEDRMWRHLQEE
jgi:energy-coupling factor transport system permease protein